MVSLFNPLLNLGRCMQRSRMACAFLLAAIFLCVSAPQSSFADVPSASATCAKNITPESTTPGKDIIQSVFDNLNYMLKKIGMSMYQNFIYNVNFQMIIIGVASLYVAFYGFLIFLNLVPHTTGEIVSRLVRIAIFFSLLSPVGIPPLVSGWVFFDRYVGTLFLGGMNELISAFTAATSGFAIPGVPTATPVPGLDYLQVTAVSTFFAPMNVVFQPFFLISMLGMLLLNVQGAIMSAAMAWAFIDFALMMFGAVVTYVRSVVALVFLFGIAPIFIAFMLFGKTQHIFHGWLNQVISFSLTPVMLFAFISFYAVLINASLLGMFQNIDFCWTHFMSIPGTPIEIGWWRPATRDPATGVWTLWSGAWQDPDGSDKALPIIPVNVLFFLILSHLGKEFSTYIGQIAQNISGGLGPGVETGEGVRSWAKSKLGGAGDSITRRAGVGTMGAPAKGNGGSAASAMASVRPGAGKST